MRLRLTSLAALGLALAIGGTSRANLITNGSFENASIDPGRFTTLGKGSTAITNWVVSRGSIDYIGTYWQAADGVRSIDLSGGGPGGLRLSQSFATTIGASYNVSFSMAGNPDGDPTLKTLSAYASSTDPAGQSPIQTFTFDATGKSKKNMGWLTKTFTFVATGSQSTLTFASLVSTPYGAALDNVSVVRAVPEPASMAMCGTALLVGAGLVARRRKARVAQA